MKTKLKTTRGAVKRFKQTGNGGLKRASAGRRHILTKKSPKRKRQLRGSAMRQVDKSDVLSVRRQLNLQ